MPEQYPATPSRLSASTSAWRRIVSSPLRSFVLILLLAAAVRSFVLVSGVLPPSYFRPFGEMGKIARSLARTGRFADPYKIPTGPTAHAGPLYPAIQGFILRHTGETPAFGYARGVLAILAFSTLYAMLPWLGLRLGLPAPAGLIAGLAGAAFPQQQLTEIIGGSDQPFAGIALGLLAVAFLLRWTGGRVTVVRSLLLGAGCGAALHLSPPLLFVLLGWVGFELVWTRDGRKWTHAACIVFAAITVCAPWTVRNYTAFHTFLFIRGNFGLELRLANHDGAHPDIDVTVAREPDFRHPSANLDEARKLRDLGEAEYMRQSRNEALAWIGHHPLEFLRLTLLHALYFWFGPLRQPWTAAITLLAILGLRRILPMLTTPQRAALLIPLAAFPLVYYFVSYVGHYRAPLEPLLLLLASASLPALAKPATDSGGTT